MFQGPKGLKGMLQCGGNTVCNIGSNMYEGYFGRIDKN